MKKNQEKLGQMKKLGYVKKLCEITKARDKLEDMF